MAENPYDRLVETPASSNPYDNLVETPQDITRYSPELKAQMAQTLRPILEYGGLAAGSMVGGSPMSPTGIAGAGLGYGIGRQGANVLDQLLIGRQPQDPLTEIAAAGKDVAGGAMMEMGGGVAGNLLSRGGQAIAKSGFPEWLYSKAIKTPMTESWKRTVPTKDWTQREQALALGMEQEIKPTVLGKQEVLAKIEDLKSSVYRTVQELEKQNILSGGAQNTPVSELVKVLDPLKYKATMSRNLGNVSTNAVDDLRQSIIAKGGVNQVLSPGQLQTLKQQFQKDVNYDLTKEAVNEAGRFTTAGTKAIATKAMETLETLAPELQYLNKKEAAYILLQKAIENTIARYENQNAVGFAAKYLSVHNIGLAAIDITTGTPAVKAAMAFALKKAGSNANKVTGRPLLLMGIREGE